MNNNIEEKLNIARQPIYDRNMEVFAYELLYRSNIELEINKAYKETEKKDDEFTTLKVIANCQLMGLNNLTYGKKAFINFASQFLINKIPKFFSPESLGIEILEYIKPEPEIIKSCIEMKNEGYTIILDDFVYSENLKIFVKIADIIKIDFLTTTIKERKQTIEQGKKYKIKFLAEKIENKVQLDLALDEGFDYFQGYYLSKPDIISITNIPGYKINYLKLLKLINKPLSALKEIENVLKREISLTYRLLKLINQLSKGKKKINSIKEALETFELGEIKNWLSLIVLSSVGHDSTQQLVNNSIIRAKFCELIAVNAGFSNEKDTCFLVGMLSNIDLFLKEPIEKLIETLPLKKEIIDALIGKKNKFFDLIMLVDNYENKNMKNVLLLAEKIGVEVKKLDELYLLAIETGSLNY